MKTIFYQFADGHTETIEVTDEVFEGISKLEKESRREEWRHQWRMRKKLVSMDGLQEKGYQFEDCNSTIEEKLIEEEMQKAARKSLRQGCDVLTAAQKELLRLIYIENKSLKEIAESMNVTYQAVQNRHTKILRRLRKFLIKGLRIPIFTLYMCKGQALTTF